MNGNLHTLVKNWPIILFLVGIIFYAAIIWSFTQQDYVTEQEFQSHEKLHETQLQYIREQLKELKDLFKHRP